MSGRSSASEEWQLKERKVARSRRPATERTAPKSKSTMSNLGPTSSKTRRSTGGAPGRRPRTPSPRRGHSGRSTHPSSPTQGRAAGGKKHATPWEDLTMDQKRSAMQRTATECGEDVDEVIRRKEANVCLICEDADHRFLNCARYKGKKTSAGTSSSNPPGTSGATAGGSATTGNKRKHSGNNPSGLTPAAKTKKPPGGFTRPSQSYAKVAAGSEDHTLVIRKTSQERSKEIHSLWLKAVVEAVQKGEGFPKVQNWKFCRDGDVVTLKDRESYHFAIHFLKKHQIDWESWRAFRKRTAWPRYQGFAAGEAMHNIPAVALTAMIGKQLEGSWELVGLKPTPTGLLIHLKLDKAAEESLQQQDSELFCCFGKVKFVNDSKTSAAKRVEGRVDALEEEIKGLHEQLQSKMVDLEAATREKEAAGDQVAAAMSAFSVATGVTDEEIDALLAEPSMSNTGVEKGQEEMDSTTTNDPQDGGNGGHNPEDGDDAKK